MDGDGWLVPDHEKTYYYEENNDHSFREVGRAPYDREDSNEEKIRLSYKNSLESPGLKGPGIIKRQKESA